MGRVRPDSVISHWSTMLPQLELSSDVFYQAIEEKIATEDLREIKVQRVDFAEGGIFSNRREYLQVRRASHVFHICAAPYGHNYFLSYWLGQIDTGIWALLSRIPGVGFFVDKFLKPITYFKLDTAAIFQSLIHGAIMETLDEWSESKGTRKLIPEERKPIMRDFLAQVKG